LVYFQSTEMAVFDDLDQLFSCLFGERTCGPSHTFMSEPDVPWQFLNVLTGDCAMLPGWKTLP
jgi:hypothetical protein